MDAANLIENEQVHVLDKNNGERFITYVLKGERGSGVICLNGPAALRVKLGDVVIVISYASMDFEKAKTFVPWVVFPDTASNKLK
jgi:aspartate 1-decarboxylase